MRIERFYHFDARAQAGSAVGHAVVLRKNNAALDKRDDDPPDGHPRSRADQEGGASPQVRSCARSQGLWRWRLVRDQHRVSRRPWRVAAPAYGPNKCLSPCGLDPRLLALAD